MVIWFLVTRIYGSYANIVIKQIFDRYYEKERSGRHEIANAEFGYLFIKDDNNLFYNKIIIRMNYFYNKFIFIYYINFKL